MELNLESDFVHIDTPAACEYILLIAHGISGLTSIFVYGNEESVDARLKQSRLSRMLSTPRLFPWAAH